MNGNKLNTLTELRDHMLDMSEKMAQQIKAVNQAIDDEQPLDITAYIEQRAKKIADNLGNTDAILSKVRKHGNFVKFREGAIKQISAQISLCGLTNSGNKEKMLDLLDARVSAAEATLLHTMSKALYMRSGKSDLAMDGLLQAAPEIDEVFDASALKQYFEMAVNRVNNAGGECDLIILGPKVYAGFISLMTPNFDQSKDGFSYVEFMKIPVVMQSSDLGIDQNYAYFLSTKHLELRPHKAREFIPVKLRDTVSNDNVTETHAIIWAGNFVSTKPCHRLLEMKS